MLTFLGNRQRFCDGINRRNFLKIGAFGAGLTLADMLRLQRRRPAAPTATSAEVGHHDLPAGRPVAHGHVRPEARRPGRVPRRVQADQHQRPRRRRSASTSRCRPACWTSSPSSAPSSSVDEHSDSQVMTGYSENSQPHRAPPVVRLGDVEAARRRQQRHPAVRQPARHERRHRAGLPRRRPPAVHAGRPGPRQPAAAPAASTPIGMDDRKALLTSFDTVRRDIDASGTMKGMDAFTGRAFDMVASGAVRKALDLTQRRPAHPRPLQGRRAVPDGPPAGRGRRRLRHAVHRRLGHAQQQLQDAQDSNCRRWTAASPT